MTTFSTLDEALSAVETRFLNNLPKEEIERVDRLFFQIEQAHWFYEDHIKETSPHLPKFTKLKTFAAHIFEHCELLSPMKQQFEELFAQFSAYKSLIPTNGCILLNKDCTKFVLCKSYFGNSWGFPRGKVNQGEEPYECALRETQEETGFDATLLSNRNNFLMHVENDQKTVRMYIALGVPEDFPFAPTTRCEVSEVAFHPIDAVPKGAFGITPFIYKLKRWIKSNRTMIANSMALCGDTTGQQKTGGKARSTSAGAGASRKQIVITGIVPRQAIVAEAQAQAQARTQADKLSARERRSASVMTTKPRPVPGSDSNTTPKPTRRKARGGGGTSLENQFDGRNELTFADEFTPGAGEAAKRWSVVDMFKANHKLTGVDYDQYDGNPHTFGSYHPRYVNYNDRTGSVGATSVSSATTPATTSHAAAGTNTTGLRLLSSLSSVSGTNPTSSTAAGSNSNSLSNNLSTSTGLYMSTAAASTADATAVPFSILSPAPDFSNNQCPQLKPLEDISINKRVKKSIFVTGNTSKAVKKATHFIVGDAFASPFQFAL